jgi:predicted SAM-dependent methyltransferase
VNPKCIRKDSGALSKVRKRARAVFSDWGSAAVQAIMQGVPVFNIGDNPRELVCHHAAITDLADLATLETRAFLYSPEQCMGFLASFVFPRGEFENGAVLNHIDNYFSSLLQAKGHDGLKQPARLRIEMGSGGRPRKAGWKQNDIRAVAGVDFVCNAWELDRAVGEETVDALFSRHMFEHLTYKQCERAAECWIRILKPGGTVEISLPNLDFHLQQLVEKKDIPGTDTRIGWRRHGLAGLYGHQNGTLEEIWDVHKSGWDHTSIQGMFRDKGFEVHKVVSKANHRDIHVVFAKPKSVAEGK